MIGRRAWDAFLRGTDTGVVLGSFARQWRSPQCPLAPELPPPPKNSCERAAALADPALLPTLDLHRALIDATGELDVATYTLIADLGMTVTFGTVPTGAAPVGALAPAAGPAAPVVRYERAQPEELLHLDTKKLGRFWHVGKRNRQDGIQRSPRAGWHHVHVAVDDHSRLAYAELRPTDRRGDALTFLERALAWFRTQGIPVQAVMTDYGSAYRSAAWRRHCTARGLRHLRTRPYTPRTNGKAERFVQILLRHWAYGFAYPTSAHRTRALSGWLRWYNRRRPHGSLGALPPVTRVSHLCGQYT